MLMNMPRLKVRRARTQTVKGPAIGDADARVFTCPGCSRPLPNGTWKCPGCGVRLLLGVKLQRAGAIAGIGALIGAVAVVILGLTFLGWLGPTAGAAAESGPSGATGATPSGGSGVSGVPAVLPPNVPATAVGALRGTATINARILADAAALNRLLAKKNDQTIPISRALRALGADAQQGIDMTGRMAGWADATDLRKQLTGFYALMADTARDGLQLSLTDKNGYRNAGKKMVAVVKAVAAVDAVSRTLAGTVNMELPLIGLPVPKAPAASTAP